MEVYRKCFGKEITGDELFVGIDVHKTTWHVTIVDRRQHIVTKFSQPSDAGALLERLSKAKSEGLHVSCAYEAGYFGFTLARKLAGEGYPCMATPPNMIPVIVGQKVKTDSIDSKKLAIFLCKGILKGVWIPPEEMHHHRAMQRARDETQKAKKVLMAQIKAKFSEYGVNFAESGHWSKAFIESLLATEMGSRELNMVKLFQISRLRSLVAEVESYDTAIRNLKSHPMYRDAVSCLVTIPGVGVLTAMRILLEIGDFRRFPSAGTIGSFRGLTPSQYTSGDSVKMGHISRCGKRQIRETLTEASWNLVRRDPGMNAFFKAISLRRDRKRAIVAVGRKLITIMRAMVIGGNHYVSRPMPAINA